MWTWCSWISRELLLRHQYLDVVQCTSMSCRCSLNWNSFTTKVFKRISIQSLKCNVAKISTLFSNILNFSSHQNQVFWAMSLLLREISLEISLFISISVLLCPWEGNWSEMIFCRYTAEMSYLRNHKRKKILWHF